MSLIIISLAICLIVGSMLWVLPSPKERKKMALRRDAMRKGIQVQLSKLDDPLNPLDKIHCVAYRLPRKRIEKDPRPWLLYEASFIQNADMEGWGFVGRTRKPEPEYQDKLKPMLSRLPSSVIALESTPGALGVYWKEEGITEDVEAIYEVLNTLNQV